MKTILSAAAALAIVLGSTAAFADSGDAPQTSQPVQYGNETVTAAPLASDVNSEALPTFGGRPATVALNTDGLLPSNGNEAPVQSANSTPVGFGIDTVALASHGSGLPHLALR